MNAFRCSRTGVLFPGDYVELWGVRYGIGLGPSPVSEALTNDYSMDPVGNNAAGSPAMHPVGTCGAQVDFVQISDGEFEIGRAVLAVDDPTMQVRAGIMRGRQLLKSGRLAVMYPAEVEKAKVKAGLLP